MNHFLELTLCDDEKGIIVYVRPEHVSAVEHFEGEQHVVVRMTNGMTYQAEPGQFTISKLINRTTHAGMRVL